MWSKIKELLRGKPQTKHDKKNEPKFLKIKVKIKDTKINDEVELAPKDPRKNNIDFSHYDWQFGIGPIANGKKFTIVEKKDAIFGKRGAYKKQAKGILSLKDPNGKIYILNFTSDTPIILVKQIS